MMALRARHRRCVWRAGVPALLVACFALACASEVPEAFDRSDYVIHTCEDPRPVGCPRIGDPVCGRYKEGNIQTFANACRACFNPAVVEWHDDPCFPEDVPIEP
jgi:hypothetical protein